MCAVSSGTVAVTTNITNNNFRACIIYHIYNRDAKGKPGCVFSRGNLLRRRKKNDATSAVGS